MRKIRCLVVDDSAAVRRLVTQTLDAEPAIEVVGTASNGAVALDQIPELKPDVLTLDIDMPRMDGVETLRRVRAQFPRLRVVMFSDMTEKAGLAALGALSLGADDYLTKSQSVEGLIPKILQFYRATPALLEMPVRKSMEAGAPQVVAIGISTGGPAALASILPLLPRDFPLPVLVVQHMPPLFTRLLAERLDATCPLAVSEAQQGDLVEPGRIFLAPGDQHMTVLRSRNAVRIVLDQEPPENSCRPAVDRLFAGVEEIYGGAAIAVVMTGMGCDGLRGTKLLKQRGARVLAQDEESSTVWGMPGAIVEAGLAEKVLPLEGLVPQILRMVG